MMVWIFNTADPSTKLFPRRRGIGASRPPAGHLALLPVMNSEDPFRNSCAGDRGGGNARAGFSFGLDVRWERGAAVRMRTRPVLVRTLPAHGGRAGAAGRSSCRGDCPSSRQRLPRHRVCVREEGRTAVNPARSFLSRRYTMRTTTKPLLALTAGDLMTRDVLTLSQEMSLRDAARLLVRHQIGGAPVVDAQGRCVGVLSATDFVRRAEARDEVTRPPSPPLPVTCGFQAKHRTPGGKEMTTCTLPPGA